MPPQLKTKQEAPSSTKHATAVHWRSAWYAKINPKLKKIRKTLKTQAFFMIFFLVCLILDQSQQSKPPVACLVNDTASFDTAGGPGGSSVVERKDFQAKQPLCPPPSLHFYHNRKQEGWTIDSKGCILLLIFLLESRNLCKKTHFFLLVYTISFTR